MRVPLVLGKGGATWKWKAPPTNPEEVPGGVPGAKPGTLDLDLRAAGAEIPLVNGDVLVPVAPLVTAGPGEEVRLRAELEEEVLREHAGAVVRGNGGGLRLADGGGDLEVRPTKGGVGLLVFKGGGGVDGGAKGGVKGGGGADRGQERARALPPSVNAWPLHPDLRLGSGYPAPDLAAQWAATDGLAWFPEWAERDRSYAAPGELYLWAKNRAAAFARVGGTGRGGVAVGRDAGGVSVAQAGGRVLAASAAEVRGVAEIEVAGVPAQGGAVVLYHGPGGAEPAPIHMLTSPAGPAGLYVVGDGGTILTPAPLYLAGGPALHVRGAPGRVTRIREYNLSPGTYVAKRAGLPDLQFAAVPGSIYSAAPGASFTYALPGAVPAAGFDGNPGTRLVGITTLAGGAVPVTEQAVAPEGGAGGARWASVLELIPWPADPALPREVVLGAGNLRLDLPEGTAVSQVRELRGAVLGRGARGAHVRLSPEAAAHPGAWWGHYRVHAPRAVGPWTGLASSVEVIVRAAVRAGEPILLPSPGDLPSGLTLTDSAGEAVAGVASGAPAYSWEDVGGVTEARPVLIRAPRVTGAELVPGEGVSYAVGGGPHQPTAPAPFTLAHAGGNATVTAGPGAVPGDSATIVLYGSREVVEVHLTVVASVPVYPVATAGPAGTTARLYPIPGALRGGRLYILGAPAGEVHGGVAIGGEGREGMVRLASHALAPTGTYDLLLPGGGWTVVAGAGGVSINGGPAAEPAVVGVGAGGWGPGDPIPELREAGVPVHPAVADLEVRDDAGPRVVVTAPTGTLDARDALPAIGTQGYELELAYAGPPAAAAPAGGAQYGYSFTGAGGASAPLGLVATAPRGPGPDVAATYLGVLELEPRGYTVKLPTGRSFAYPPLSVAAAPPSYAPGGGVAAIRPQPPTVPAWEVATPAALDFYARPLDPAREYRGVSGTTYDLVGRQARGGGNGGDAFVFLYVEHGSTLGLRDLYLYRHAAGPGPASTDAPLAHGFNPLPAGYTAWAHDYNLGPRLLGPTPMTVSGGTVAALPGGVNRVGGGATILWAAPGGYGRLL
jgi:hypothetical protein